jgi:hypothetical protein
MSADVHPLPFSDTACHRLHSLTPDEGVAGGYNNEDGKLKEIE